MEGATNDSKSSDTAAPPELGEGSGDQDQGMGESRSVASFNTDNKLATAAGPRATKMNNNRLQT